tara:strand:+ start:786 stop:2579 length:1794 start_codon:yes stop_codon:yes gene_type:complete
MAKKKKVPIRYTNRDYSSIKDGLVDHAKRYYPDTFKDFNEAGFGSLMLDTVAYVGDILSFYLDYQVNESFMDTAIEPENVLRLARQMGYKANLSPSSFGFVALYIIVPAATSGLGPATEMLPTLMKGSELSSTGGVGFILIEDVYFGDPKNEIVVARVNETTGVPTSYAIRAYAQVMSGQLKTETISVGAYAPFLRVELPESNVAEVVSVFDNEGHEYFEVDYLSQNVVYKEIRNTDSNQDSVASILKPMSVPRRYVVERRGNTTVLQFGAGSESEMSNGSFKDPSEVVLNVHGRSYITDTSMDPSVLNSTDKLGIVPSSTTLTIAYRANPLSNVSIAARTLTNVSNPIWRFDQGDVSVANRRSIEASVESTNEKPIIGGGTETSIQEIKIRTADHYATQNRAVTKADYMSMVYNMPARFGSVKRCNILQDHDSLKRNLNLYVISENSTGKLIETNATIKENLKTWLKRVKMINDTIDILDAKVVNLGIDFTIVADPEKSKFDVLAAASDRLRDLYNKAADIGEIFSITQVWQELNQVSGVDDVVDVRVRKKVGGRYSSTTINVDERTSPDGRYVSAPENVVFEIKFPDQDIKGTVQ